MNIVVTGASGFLGRAVLRRLAATDAKVVAVGRRPAQGAICVDSYADTPPGDVLIHLANSALRITPEEAADDYERQTALALGALLSKPYQRIVYASSAVLYGDAATTPRRPDDEVHVDDAYTRVKRHGEFAVLDSGIGAVARLTNLFGAGMSSETAISAILQQIPGKGPLHVRDAGPVRDFLWIDDAADAIARMAAGWNVGVFNVGTGVGTSIGAVARLALAIAGEEERAVVSTHAQARESHLVLEISHTMATWHWSPVTSLQTGLSRLVRARATQMHE